MTSPPLPVLFTIGHSNHPLDRFLALLRGAGIGILADVRSHPQSRFAPHFNRKNLEAALAAAGIDYLFLGDRLGGRPKDSRLYRDDKLDCAAVWAAEFFQKGIDEALAAAGTKNLALMCAEKNPLDCHRHFLLAPALAARGAQVRHILADGEIAEYRALL